MEELDNIGSWLLPTCENLLLAGPQTLPDLTVVYGPLIINSWLYLTRISRSIELVDFTPMNLEFLNLTLVRVLTAFNRAFTHTPRLVNLLKAPLISLCGAVPLSASLLSSLYQLKNNPLAQTQMFEVLEGYVDNATMSELLLVPIIWRLANMSKAHQREVRAWLCEKLAQRFRLAVVQSVDELQALAYCLMHLAFADNVDDDLTPQLEFATWLQAVPNYGLRIDLFTHILRCAQARPRILDVYVLSHHITEPLMATTELNDDLIMEAIDFICNSPDKGVLTRGPQLKLWRHLVERTLTGNPLSIDLFLKVITELDLDSFANCDHLETGRREYLLQDILIVFETVDIWQRGPRATAAFARLLSILADFADKIQYNEEAGQVPSELPLDLEFEVLYDRLEEILNEAPLAEQSPLRTRLETLADSVF